MNPGAELAEEIVSGTDDFTSEHGKVNDAQVSLI
jgi:hypothetical protein